MTNLLVDEVREEPGGRHAARFVVPLEAEYDMPVKLELILFMLVFKELI